MTTLEPGLRCDGCGADVSGVAYVSRQGRIPWCTACPTPPEKGATAIVAQSVVDDPRRVRPLRRGSGGRDPRRRRPL